jgi:hypothetical protein
MWCEKQAARSLEETEICEFPGKCPINTQEPDCVRRKIAAFVIQFL